MKVKPDHTQQHPMQGQSQWAQIEIQEIKRKTLLLLMVTKHSSNGLVREGGDSSALKIRKTQLDTFPRNLLYLTLLWVGVVDLQRSLPISIIFCDPIHNLRERRQCKKKQVTEGKVLLSGEFVLSSNWNNAVAHRQNSSSGRNNKH